MSTFMRKGPPGRFVLAFVLVLIATTARGEELGTVYIRNWTSDRAAVWIDNAYQGYVVGNKMMYTVREGFVTQDSGYRADGTLVTKESHAGWPDKGPVSILIMTDDERTGRTFWRGILPGDQRDVVCYFGKNQEPDDLERENATQILKGAWSGPPPDPDKKVAPDDFAGQYQNPRYALTLNAAGTGFRGTLIKDGRTMQLDATPGVDKDDKPVLTITAVIGGRTGVFLAVLNPDGSLVLSENETVIRFTSNKLARAAYGGIVKKLGTGDVQVTLRWQGSPDLDLHVIDPAGEEIWFQHRTAASGGQLDVDDQNGSGPENIFWPTNGAPSGHYKAYVVLYSGAVASWQMQIQKGGQKTSYTGRLVGEGSSTQFIDFDFSNRPNATPHP